jgi:hypothetical protein
MLMFIVQCSKATPNAGDRPIPTPSSWRLPPLEDTIDSVVEDLLEGQYTNPVRVIDFDPADGRRRDFTPLVARKLRRRCADQSRETPEFLQQFLVGSERPMAEPAVCEAGEFAMTSLGTQQR